MTEYLHQGFHCSNVGPQWERACEILAGMEALQELRVNIKFRPENKNKERLTEKICFEALGMISRPSRVFEVKVDWLPGVEMELETKSMTTLPFLLRRI